MDIKTVLAEYSHMFAEPYSEVLNHFNRMENFEQFAVEIELAVEHTNEMVVRLFIKELEKLGYRWHTIEHDGRIVDLIVSKYGSIGDILSEAVPAYENAIVRGLFFGYSPKEIKEYMDRTGETQI